MNETILQKNKRTIAAGCALWSTLALCLLAAQPVRARELAVTPELFGRHGSFRVQFNEAGELPLDPEVRFEGQPTWRYQPEGGDESSTAFLYFLQPLNLQAHLPGGHLEFSLKSTAVAERMLIGVGFSNDWSSGERYMSYNQGSLEWKTFRIPLRELGVPGTVQRLVLVTTGEPESKDMTFWISDVRIVP